MFKQSRDPLLQNYLSYSFTTFKRRKHKSSTVHVSSRTFFRTQPDLELVPHQKYLIAIAVTSGVRIFSELVENMYPRA